MNTPSKRWPWVLAGTALVLVSLSLVAAVVLAGLAEGAREGFHLSIDGEVIPLLQPGFEANLGTVFGLMLAVLVVLLVVPLVLLLVAVSVVTVLGLVALAVATALAAAVASVLLVLVLATSPLWLLALLLWWLLRREPAAGVAA